MKLERTVLALGAVALLASVWQTASAQDVPADAVEKIRAAAPEKATAKPARPRKLLVYTACGGFRHGSIPYAARALEIMGAGTGAYQTVVSDDMAMFEPETLAQFDAVCMDSTTGELFLAGDATAEAAARAERLRRSLLDFVAGGKGLVGIHAATDCSYKWPEYGEMIGGYFSGHPWNEKVAVKVEEPDHPLCAAFKGQDFEITDEIYQFRDPYSRGKLRVLLSLDTGKTDMTKEGIGRTDGDFAVSWVRAYGKGRVFYCSLGHRNEIFWNAAILRHYLDGIQFALGDLAADATPSALTGGEWQSLFNGVDLAGWQCKPGGWHVEAGAIAWKQGAGFLWSEKRYGDFVLDLEFKVDSGTNSGVFIRTDSKSNWLHTGIEVQIMDSHGKAQPSRHDCGAIYDCLAPSSNPMRPAGEWNRMTVTCRDNIIEVSLNDVEIIDMDLDLWTEPHKNPDGSGNKFNNAYKDMAREGYVGFQDHGKPVWFRNIRIRALDGKDLE